MRRNSKLHEEEEKSFSRRGSKAMMQQRKRLKRLEEVIESNRQSIASMSKEKQEKICSICFSEMEPDSIASLESCPHQFCFECIKQWGSNCANTCPLCKKRFNSI